jgi:two-component system cell cycle sensor histidine kinase/response regulator CckA
MSGADANVDPDLTALLREPSAPSGDRKGTQGEDHFHALLSRLQQVFWMQDADRGILYVSPAYETIWGRTCQSVHDDYGSFLESIHPDDRARIMAAMMHSHGADEEFRILRPDGELRWIWARSYPLPEEHGPSKRFAGIAEDITARKAGETERLRLAAIIECSDDAVVTITVDGIVIGWNQGAEHYYGYTAEEMIGHPILVLFPPDRYQEYLQILRNIRSGERLPTYDTVRRRKDGSLINVSLGMTLVEARDGEIAGASKIAHDISRIKALEAQLVEAQKMEVMGQLAGGIAHDFNNLLTAILGYTELLLPEFEGQPQHLKDLEQIRKSATLASHLTHQLLAFSRQQALQPIVVDMNELVTSTAMLLRRLIGEDITLTLTLGESLGRVKIDPGQIEQVIMNLAINARDAMPSGGQLRIQTTNADVDDLFFKRLGIRGPDAGRHFVGLIVSDTGTGMDAVTRRRIFEPFFTTKPKGKGTGLGLATVHGIVSQSRGAIWAESEPGQGTTFRIYLPRTDEIKSAEIPASASEPSTTGDETILLVEDDETVRELSRALLERRGYRVISAVDAAEAMALAASEAGTIHLLLTDVVLPGASGPELAQLLQPLRPLIKVLYCSGYTDEAFVRRGVLTAGVPFLEKPFTATELPRKVREVLDAESTPTT